MPETIAHRLARFETPSPIDVVILGAGVNGAGLFRDLCEQGVDCLILDKADFGSGTSAAPSRMIHGGLKYLETGEFRLVAQSTLERNLLLRNAPHTVAPLPTLIPIFSWLKGIGAATRTLFGSKTAPRSRGAALIKIGLSIYDFYGARNRVMPRHKLMSRKAALATLPAINQNIRAAALYYDARITRPERLVYELVADGLKANERSAAANYAELVSAENGALSFAVEGKTYAVRPKLVVNAAGPWIDHVNAQLGSPSKLIGGTKGSHLLLKNDELVRQLDGRMVYFETDEGRICLAYEYLGHALIGSTDIRADNPDTVHCEEGEILYMLASLQALMPGLKLSRDQITYVYSGIRPLPRSDAAVAGLISRDHSAPVIEQDATRPFPIISLVGGKWTTFRGFAEEVADTVLSRLARARKVSTRNLPIGGGRDYPMSTQARHQWLADAAAKTGLDTARLDQLLSRYGTTALELAGDGGQGMDAERLPGSSDTSLAEIDAIARREAVQHLSDIVMRRTTLAIGGTLTRGDLEAIAEVAGHALGWDEARRVREIEQTITELTKRNMMRL